MYNCVNFERADAFLKCLLWRNLDISQQPQTFQVLLNHIGIKPAGMITTLSFQKNAHSFEEKFPVTATQIKRKSYVDDLGITGHNRQEVRKRAEEVDLILEHANMKVERWI